MKDIRYQLIEKCGSIEAAEAILCQKLREAGMPEDQVQDTAEFVMSEMDGGELRHDALQVLTDNGLLDVDIEQ